MAVVELPQQQRFFPITCDADCGNSVHVTATDEQAAMQRVREVWSWRADETGQWCPLDSEGRRAA